MSGVVGERSAILNYPEGGGKIEEKQIFSGRETHRNLMPRELNCVKNQKTLSLKKLKKIEESYSFIVLLPMPYFPAFRSAVA